MDQPPNEDSRDFVTALARGLSVLQACAANPKGITLSEAARRTGLSRATVRRSLLTLAATGYVIGNDRHFLLTPKVLSLGAGLAPDSLPRLAQPILDRLSHPAAANAAHCFRSMNGCAHGAQSSLETH